VFVVGVGKLGPGKIKAIGKLSPGEKKVVDKLGPEEKKVVGEVQGKPFFFKYLIIFIRNQF
jgi:hypothetical protein